MRLGKGQDPREEKLKTGSKEYCAGNQRHFLKAHSRVPLKNPTVPPRGPPPAHGPTYGGPARGAGPARSGAPAGGGGKPAGGGRSVGRSGSRQALGHTVHTLSLDPFPGDAPRAAGGARGRGAEAGAPPRSAVSHATLNLQR